MKQANILPWNADAAPAGGDDGDGAAGVTGAVLVQSANTRCDTDSMLAAMADHPWVTEHPEWFTTRADGTIVPRNGFVQPPRRKADLRVQQKITLPRRVALERHHTLRAAVEWSYALLDDRDRAVFERLAVFSGSFNASTQ